jgi:hypothetical protein
VDHAGDPPQQAQQQVDEQLGAAAINHGHPDWWQEQRHDDRTTVGHCVWLFGGEAVWSSVKRNDSLMLMVSECGEEGQSI